MTRDHDEQISYSEAAGSSRRRILRALGIGGASSLLAVMGLEALAGERPHQRLQDRTPKRNRKQRNKRQNNKNNQNNQTSGGGGLGSLFGLGVSVAFQNKSTVGFEVYIPASDQLLECGPGFNATLDQNDQAVSFIFRLPEWGEDDLQFGALNPDIGEPWVEFGEEGVCDSGEDCYDHHPLSVGESFQFDWEQRSFTAERQSDSSNYKMFLITALA